MPETQRNEQWGCYGLRVSGLADPGRTLCEVPASWPLLRIRQERVDRRRRPADRLVGVTYIDEDAAVTWLDDRSRVELDRSTLEATILAPTTVPDEALAHPLLGVPAAVVAHWHGRQVLHGASFLRAGRAIGLLGAKESGKSSTLAWLDLHGHHIASDDLLVTDGADAFAGPRSIDLRPEAAARFGGEDLGQIGGRARARLRPGAVAAASPLAGLVHLVWGERTALEPLPPSERLVALLEHANLANTRGGDPGGYLVLAAIPAWRFVRPRDLDRIDDAITLLLEHLPG